VPGADHEEADRRVRDDGRRPARSSHALSATSSGGFGPGKTRGGPMRPAKEAMGASQCATAAHPHPRTGPGPPGSDQGAVGGVPFFSPGTSSAHVMRGLRDGADLWLEGRNRLRSCHLHITDPRRRFRCPTRALSPTERARSPWPQASVQKSPGGSRIRGAWWTGWQRRPNARSSSKPWLQRWSGTTSNSAANSKRFEPSGRMLLRYFALLQTI
jgi:hypothetical protein